MPEWTAEFNAPWLPIGTRIGRRAALAPHWEDLAWRVQDDTETVLLARAKWLRETTGAKNLCIAGGVGLNCVANGRIVREAGFDNVWIQPASGDDGIAIGCAYYGHLAIKGAPRSFVMTDAYLGRSYDDEDVSAALAAGLARFETSARISEDICAEAASLLAQGRVLGWFQGRSEFGPRALGNRSILADPRDAKMKDTLNARVKHRQAFRPFAPIVLAERAHEIFEGEEESPFMLIAKRVREAWRDKIPAIVHVDGTARVQTVRAETNDRLYRLLKAVRGADRRARAHQHLLQRQGRAHRRDAARCDRVLSFDRHRRSRPARQARGKDRLPSRARAGHGHVLRHRRDRARRIQRRLAC